MSDSRKKFAGSPLKLPQPNASGAMSIDMEHTGSEYSAGLRDGLRRICFEGPLTPLPKGDYVAFNTSTVGVDQTAYSPRDRLQRICFEDALTPLTSEGNNFGSSDVTTDQIPILHHFFTMSGQPDDGQLPPRGSTREYETRDGPLTPSRFDMEAEEAGWGESSFVASAR
jgi:hypothetical protein